jgi:hypothetical protein
MNTNLDINTPKGRAAAVDQERAAYIVFRDANTTFYPTDDHGAAKVDGIIVRNGFIQGVVEIKSRNMRLSQLLTEFRSEWLLTMEKLEDIARASALLGAPGYGLLYLVPDHKVLAARLSDKDGVIVCNYRIDRTLTQATCNGGCATRDNAFISMEHSKIYTDPNPQPELP